MSSVGLARQKEKIWRDGYSFKCMGVLRNFIVGVNTGTLNCITNNTWIEVCAELNFKVIFATKLSNWALSFWNFYFSFNLTAKSMNLQLNVTFLNNLKLAPNAPPHRKLQPRSKSVISSMGSTSLNSLRRSVSPKKCLAHTHTLCRAMRTRMKIDEYKMSSDEVFVSASFWTSSRSLKSKFSHRSSPSAWMCIKYFRSQTAAARVRLSWRWHWTQTWKTCVLRPVAVWDIRHDRSGTTFGENSYIFSISSSCS